MNSLQEHSQNIGGASSLFGRLKKESQFAEQNSIKQDKAVDR